MYRFVLLSAIVLATMTAVSHLLAADTAKPRPLADAVKEFNQRAQKDSIGKNQPPLTVDEVVAAIRSWDRQNPPANNAVYKAFQDVATTKQLPPSAKLQFITGSDYHGLHFDVWWIDLSMMTGPKSGYTYRLRDRKVRCRAIDPQSDDFLTSPPHQGSR